MHEKIMLWNSPVEGEFQPCLELSTLDEVDGPLGMVIVFPGGGYHARAEYEGVPVAECFNRLGFHAATLEYRVHPQVCYPGPQQDALRAVKILRSRAAELKIRPDNIAVLGFSAGGHLAGCCGTIWNEIDASDGDAADAVDSRPDAMILCYPVISLDKDFGHVGSGRRLMCSAKKLLDNEDPDPAELEKLRLDLRVTADTPPTFLWHTATDKTVPVHNSVAFAEAMWANKNTAELHVFPRGSHGISWGAKLDKIPEVRIWPTLADRFLRTVFRTK